MYVKDARRFPDTVYARKKSPLPIYKVLVRPDLESKTRPSNAEAVAMSRRAWLTQNATHIHFVQIHGALCDLEVFRAQVGSEGDSESERALSVRSVKK